MKGLIYSSVYHSGDTESALNAKFRWGFGKDFNTNLMHRLYLDKENCFFICYTQCYIKSNISPTSDSVVSSWKICPSPSTWRTHILQARSTVLVENRSRVKQQWRFLCEPLQTCWKESSCNDRKTKGVTVLDCQRALFKVVFNKVYMTLPGTWLVVCSSTTCGGHHGWKVSGCGCCL